MRITTVLRILSCVLAAGGVMASSAQDKPQDTTQAAVQAAPVAAPAETKAPAPKPAEDKPEGKVIGKIYADWNYDVTQNAPATLTEKSLIELTRVYLGYDYKIDKAFSTEAMLDVQRIDPYTAPNNSNVGSTVKVDTGKATNLNTVSVEGPLSLKINDSYIAYVKTAYVAFKGIPLTTITAGQMSYFAFDVMESFWGHRYVYKTLMDQLSWESSADLGAKAMVNILDLVKITLGVTNGEGYKANQDAFGDYKVAGAVQANPIKDLTIYVYGDWMPERKNTQDSAQKTIAAFVGYNILDKAKIGLEYDNQVSQGGIRLHDANGVSLYAMYNIIKELEVFGRFDLASSRNYWSTNDGQTMLAGVQYSPVKNVKFALDYQRVKPRVLGASITANKVFLNGEFDY